jgi:hypothetical protein
MKSRKSKIISIAKLVGSGYIIWQVRVELQEGLNEDTRSLWPWSIYTSFEDDDGRDYHQKISSAAGVTWPNIKETLALYLVESLKVPRQKFLLIK